MDFVKKKKKSVFVSHRNKIFLIGISLATLLLGIGYAQLTHQTLFINADADVEPIEDVVITSVTSSNISIPAYTSNSVNSTVTLSPSDPTDTASMTITVYNNSSVNQYFLGTTVDSGIGYTNPGIVYTISGIDEEELIEPGESKTFTVTFSYKDGQLQESNILTSFIQFNFSTLDSMTFTADNSPSATYTGAALTPSGVTVSTPSSGVEIKYGTTEGTYDSSSIPTFTEVGTHTVYYQIKAEGYLTERGSYTFTIEKATPVITLSANTGTVVEGYTMTFTATVSSGAASGNVTGTLSVSSGTTTVATISPASSNITATPSGFPTTITVTGVTNGTSTITVGFTPGDTDNYNTPTSVTYTAEIVKSATIPTNTLCVNRTYTGVAQNLTSVTSGTGYTLSNYNQTNAGEYTITATLTNGYRWSDNDTGTKSFTCTMNKATPVITLSTSSGYVEPGSTSTFIATVSSGSPAATCAGTLSASSSATNYATVSPTSTNVTANTSGIATTETITGITEGNSTITVSFTPTDTTNFNNAVNKTYSVTVITNFLMSGVSGNGSSSVLGNSNIERQDIEEIYTLTTNAVPNNAISSWDVSVAHNGSVMAYVLDEDNDGLYELYIGQTGGVRANPSSYYLFQNYNNATSIDLSDFDTSHVTTMTGMFLTCTSLTSLDLGDSFDTSNVTDMSFMFRDCNSLTSIDLGDYFDTSSVIAMNNMFGGCSSLTSLDLGDNFDTSSVTNMSQMFLNCTDLASLDLGDNFNTAAVTDMSYMFRDCSSLTTIDLGDYFDTSSVTTMNNMFGECSGLTSLDLGDNFDTSSVEDMSQMFLNCTDLVSLDLGDNFDTSSVENMSYMFRNCSSLTSLDLGDYFDTSSVTTMNNMFGNCTDLASLDLGDNFNTSSVEDMNQLFLNCSSLTSLDLGNHFDASSATDISYMFYGCSSLTSLDLGDKFDTSSVTTMREMFNGSSGLTTINLGYAFDTSSVDNMSYMFLNCSSLTTIYANSDFVAKNGLVSTEMFTGITHIVGGNGTTYNGSIVDHTRAVIDTPSTAGYFTKKEIVESIDNLTYNGNAQALVNSDRVVYYSLSTPLDSTNYESLGTTTIPTGTNAGDYVVYWYYPNIGLTGSTTTTISKATPVVTLSASSGEVFTNNTTTFVATVASGTSTTAAGTLSASSSNTSYATVSPASTNITANTSGIATTETITGVVAGTATITMSFTPADTTNFNNAVNKTYSVTITPSSYCVDGDTLANCLVYDDYGSRNYSDAISAINSKTASNFSTVSTTDEGLKAVADYSSVSSTTLDGTSYYYRGAVEDNWVSFAGYLWRVVRINGDGSVRLIYSGTTSNHTGTGTQIGTSAYNSSANNPKYVGYTYDDNGTETDSTIKGVIDTWYAANIKPSYEGYLSNEIFCNDRSIANVWSYQTIYGTYDRVYNDAPSLLCTNASDRYTLKVSGQSSISGTSGVGNNLLDYPVGLLTEDEVLLAGDESSSNINNYYYLYTGVSYWIGSPSHFSQSNNNYEPYVYYIGSSGASHSQNVSYSGSSISSPHGVRPVLNLRSSVKYASGNGTENNPYVIKQEPKITLSSTSGEVTTGDTTTFTATVFSGGASSIPGTLTVSSSDTSKATVSPASSNVTATPSGVTITETITGVADGSATITVSFVPTNTAIFSNAVNETYSVTVDTNYLMAVGEHNGYYSEYDPVIGNYNIQRRDIEEIYTLTSKNVPNNAIDSWDVSESQNGSVMAYVLDDDQDGKYELYIGQNGGVKANPNSSYLFYNYINTTSIVLDDFDTSNVTNMEEMFNIGTKTSISIGVDDTSSLTNLDLGDKFDTSAVTNMSYMFASNNLTSLDLGDKFDTSSVTNMEGMFSGCFSLTSFDFSNFDTSAVTNMSYMFSGCRNLTSLDLENFNTSAVTNMGYMFSGCKSLTSLILGDNFDTSSVTNMEGMFYNSLILTSFDLSKLDTSAVTNMSYMFSGCNNLTSLDLGDFNTSAVTNMRSMFSGCNSLTSLNLGNNFDTSSVTDMVNMFEDCSALNSIYLGDKFDTSAVTNMYAMFYGCSSLTSIDLGDYFDTSSVTDMRYMFGDCSSLVAIYVAYSFDTTNVNSSNLMFIRDIYIEGGNGTTYDSNHLDKEYARIDATGSLGYFTLRSLMPLQPMQPTLRMKLIMDDQGASSYSPSLITAIQDKSARDFSTIADTDEGLHAISDYSSVSSTTLDGTSYYYRGAVNDNWVSFAGYLWRVVRINGDGSIRLIYSGTASNHTGAGTSIGKYYYNTAYDDSKYVGYTYDTDTISNIGYTYTTNVGSNIKNIIDAWYEDNLKANYENYLSNGMFCNDRTYTTSGSTIRYGAYTRLYTNKAPSLECTNQADRYTLQSPVIANEGPIYYGEDKPLVIQITEEEVYYNIDSYPLDSSNYSSQGTTTIPTSYGLTAGHHTVNWYCPSLSQGGSVSPEDEILKPDPDIGISAKIKLKNKKEILLRGETTTYEAKIFKGDDTLGEAYPNDTLGILTVSSNNPNIATVSPISTNIVLSGYEYTPANINVTGVGLGSTTITVTFTPTDTNYAAVSNTMLINVVPGYSSRIGTSGAGNNMLEYPIGLLTADEVALAGGKQGTANNSYYLNTGQYIWLGTPNLYVNSYANMFTIDDKGKLYNGSVNGTNDVRPVINLKPSVRYAGGSGTENDPYVIQEIQTKQTPVITLSSTQETVETDQTLTFTATVTSGGTSNIAGTLTVSSSDTSVATVNPASSNVTATQAGVTTTVTVTGVAAGSSTITVVFTPTDPNYNPISTTYSATVTVPEPTLAEKIIMDDQGASSYSSSLLTAIANKPARDFSTTATTDEGLHAIADYSSVSSTTLDGASYYFRGAVEDNWVSFAGYLWRVVRINGDGSVRMIYSGTTSNHTGTGTQIGTSAYNSNYDLAKYVGYTYSNGSTEKNSTIKTSIDNWYTTNIKPSYEDYLSNEMFCNDRSVSSTSGSYTYYGAYTRLRTNNAPSLLCTNQSDRYTLKVSGQSSISGTNGVGNNLLEYPIGLLTADEAWLAGGNLNNNSYYLYTGKVYYLGSPAFYTSSTNYSDNVNAAVYRVYSGGIVSTGDDVSYNGGVRPVLNLKPSVKWDSGNGTEGSPYTVKL